MLDQGMPAEDLLGGEDTMVDLFFRDRHSQDQYNASNWASEIIKCMTGMDDLVRLGWIYLLKQLMCWLLVPTEELYAKVPGMMRPVCAQRLIPHAASIDTCPFPLLREALVYRLRDWFPALVDSGCSIHWPGDINDAVQKNPRNGTLRLTPEFCDHAAMHENWTLSEKIFDHFPEIKGRMGPAVGAKYDMTADGLTFSQPLGYL